MPYPRTTLHESTLLRVERLRAPSTGKRWSEQYVVASPRMLLPVTGLVHCEIRREPQAIDPLSSLLLHTRSGYRVRMPLPGDSVGVLLIFTQQTFDEIADFVAPGQSVVAGRAALPPHALVMTSGFARLAVAATDTLAVESAAMALLTSALAQRADRYVERSASAVWRASVERARELIVSAPEAKLSLQDIANKTSISVFHLARAFKRETGFSLHQYRLRVRMAVAVRRLAEGEDRIDRLAADLGFAHHSHFSAAFKRTFGYSPSTARHQPRPPRDMSART